MKLDNKKICAVFLNVGGSELHLYIINNYIGEKLMIRHYLINNSYLYLFNILKDLKLTVYNNFLATSFILYGDNTIGSLIIFSYGNSTDFTVDITENILSLKNPIINFKEKCKIENNLFGFIFAGIKFYDYSDGYNLIIVENEHEIEKEEVVSPDSTIQLKLTNDANIESGGRIKYGMVVIEPEYDIYKQYPIEINKNYCGDDCSDEKDIFNNNLRQWYFGRISYCDITFETENLSKDCSENCVICKADSEICLVCKYLSSLSADGGRKCYDENEIPEAVETTIILTIPTTIITTIPTTIIKALPTTIISSSHKDVISTIPTTSEKNSDKVDSVTTVIKVDEDTKKSNCTNNDIINNECQHGEITVDQINEVKKSLLNNNYTKEQIVIKTENAIIELSTIEDQQYTNDASISNIDFGECETLLKTTNHINDSLIIFKLDIKPENSSSTFVAYEIYSPYDLEKLNLSICQDVQIKVNVPITLDNYFESLIIKGVESGYNILNENDSFYNDICATYTTENGTDILLSDRKKDIYELSQNQTFCQTGCELDSYNSTNKKAQCNCLAKEETITLDIEHLFNKKEIAKSFYNTIANSNFQVIKCYKLVLDFSNFFQNYGEILMSIFFITFIILKIIYFIQGTKHIHSYINIILKYKNQEMQNKNKNLKKEKDTKMKTNSLFSNKNKKTNKSN